MTDIGSTDPSQLLITTQRQTRAHAIHYPSQSLSATSNLPTLVTRARKRLGQAIPAVKGQKSTTDPTTPSSPSTTNTPPPPTVILNDPASFVQIPYASLYIDCSWADLLFAYQACVLTTESREARQTYQTKIAELFRRRPNVRKGDQVSADVGATKPDSDASNATESTSAASEPSLVNVNSTLPTSFIAPNYLLSEHNIITALSARTCLDLYLKSRAFPRGSYVLLSAINIPDMSVVLKDYGLIPIPIDIDQLTLEPDLTLLDQAAGRVLKGHKVVAMLIAHLYGRRFDFTGVVKIAKKYQIDLIEDVAESFSGFDYVGHPASDLTLFSFGSIKVCTGFGCGIARVRDAKIYDEMMRTQSTWDVQTRSTFFTKCVKNTLTMLVLNVPFISGTVMRSARAMNFDHKALVVSMLRGFPDRLMERLRTQPSTALLSLLYRRLSTFDEIDFQVHQDTCDLMIELLPDPESVPGVNSPVRNHWLFPVMVHHVDEVLKELNANGIDAYQGATQLALVPTPDEVKGEVAFPTQAADLMKRVIYLPVHKKVPFSAILRMALIMHKVVEKVDKKYGATGVNPEAKPTSKL